MRLGILTSTQTRHRFVANTLARRFGAVLVLAEEKVRRPDRQAGSPEEQELLAGYFAERAEAERRLLPEGAAWDRSAIAAVEAVPAGEINAAPWPERMEAAGAELVAVFGTSLLKEPWLERFGGRLVNLHLGLSPYYRGSGTNFWPLYYEEPEYVGATIHLIDPGVDTGAILRHARPEIGPGDTPHTIGNRAIRAGARALAESLAEYAAGEIDPVPQWSVENARYLRSRDFTPAVLCDLLRRWNAGLLERYLAEAPARRARVRLVRETDR